MATFTEGIRRVELRIRKNMSETLIWNNPAAVDNGASAVK